MRNPNDGNKRGQQGASDLLSAAPLAFLVVLYGVIISFYAVFIRQFTTHGTVEDAVKSTAIYCAQELAAVSVTDPVFGRVGLCDSTGEGGAGPVSSLNGLYAQLRLDHLIAVRMNLPYMDQLVESDLHRVQEIELRLRKALNERATIAPSFHQKPLHEIAFERVSRQQGAERLSEFRLRLGSTAPALFDSGMQAAGRPLPGNPSLAYIQDGRYKADLNVPVAARQWTRFYQLAPQTQLCNERLFQPATTSMTPSMVLVEATLSRPDSDNSVGVKRTLSACAVVGNTELVPPPTVLMVSLPHGMPPSLRTLLSILKVSSTRNGRWQQSAGGDVPGQGRLQAPVGVSNAEMNPEPAVQEAFYHWLRMQGTEPIVPQVEAVLKASFADTQPEQQLGVAPAQLQAINSALTKDTGARTFAFLNQSGPTGNGQPALGAAFAGGSDTSAFPPSALPLRIGSDGECNIAGRHGFQRKLVEQFFLGLYQTNLAAIETRNVARGIADRMTVALKETEHQVFVTTEELNSLSSRLGRAVQAIQPRITRDIQRMRKSQSDLTSAVQNLNTKQADYKRVRTRAQSAAMNAEYTARVTYDLCTNMSSFARDGLFGARNPQGFLLRDDLIFVPKPSPATEEEIYGSAARGEPAPDSWVSAQFNVLQHTTPKTTVEGLPMSELPALRSSNRIQPRFILFDSQQLSQGSPQPRVFERSPFADRGVPDGQLVYFAADAVQSGSDQKVGWSVLMRDMVSATTINNNKRYATLSSRSKWCAGDQFAAGACPELAVEVQVRSPVPLIPNLPLGLALTNPNDGSDVLEIPPMPAGML